MKTKNKGIQRLSLVAGLLSILFLRPLGDTVINYDNVWGAIIIIGIDSTIRFSIGWLGIRIPLWIISGFRQPNPPKV